MIRTLRALLLAILLTALIAILMPMIEMALYAGRLAAMSPPDRLPVPVANVPLSRVADSWHASRSGGRVHEGIDIFAPRGTPVLSATEGIITRIGTNRLGGNVVWVLGPGGHRHYYAHLDRIAGVHTGQRVQAGTWLGYVGNTGNARGTPPHLHYGIYTPSGPVNPYPFLHGRGVLKSDQALLYREQ